MENQVLPPIVQPVIQAEKPLPKPVGMVKNVPLKSESPKISQNEVPIAPAPPTGAISLEWNGVPVEVADFFGVSITQSDPKVMEKLKDIAIWSKNNSEDSIGSRLHKIRSIESKLGAPNLFESRVDRTWKWIKMDLHINEMRKRQSAYERV